LKLEEVCRSINPRFFNFDAEGRCEKVVIQEESLFFKAIEQKNLVSWEQFEFLLTLVIENRLLLIL